jgi:hypothetical protein
VIQILLTILFSSVKFAMTFPVAVMQFEFAFFETILWTNVGGVLGIYFFAFLSGKLIAWWNRTFKRKSAPIQQDGSNGKKVFTKRNRRIVHIKQQYGLIGIALSTPIVLSIPLGTFLVVRYYRSSKSKFLYLIASNILWSVIYAGFYLFWDTLFFQGR